MACIATSPGWALPLSVMRKACKRNKRFLCLELLLASCDCFFALFSKVVSSLTALFTPLFVFIASLNDTIWVQQTFAFSVAPLLFHPWTHTSSFCWHVEREWVRWSIICVCLSSLIDFFLFFFLPKSFFARGLTFRGIILRSHLGSGVDWIHAMMSAGACLLWKFNNRIKNHFKASRNWFSLWLSYNWTSLVLGEWWISTD